ncbi:ATP-binding protein [Enterovibrio sp. NIFS-20-8]|nr:ATP-binding protein [Enterovibrio paralichthyis]
MTHLPFKQRGTFSVEFALLAVVFAAFIILTGDIVIKLSMQGQLDRLSYSMVNVLKERTQLYDPDFMEIDSQSTRELNSIISHSLGRMVSNYDASKMGTTFESLTFPNGRQTLDTIEQGGGCQLTDTLADHQDLSMMTSWGRRASLYRVTICYETDNWAGASFDTEFTTVQSSSIMMGR